MVIFLSPPHAALRDGPVSACLPRLAPSRLWEWWAGPRLWQGPNSSATRGHFSFCWYFCWYFQHATNWNQAFMRVSRHFSIPCGGPLGGFTPPHTASKPAWPMATAGFSFCRVFFWNGLPERFLVAHLPEAGPVKKNVQTPACNWGQPVFLNMLQMHPCTRSAPTQCLEKPQ